MNFNLEHALQCKKLMLWLPLLDESSMDGIEARIRIKGYIALTQQRVLLWQCIQTSRNRMTKSTAKKPATFEFWVKVASSRQNCESLGTAFSQRPGHHGKSLVLSLPLYDFQKKKRRRPPLLLSPINRSLSNNCNICDQ